MQRVLLSFWVLLLLLSGLAAEQPTPRVLAQQDPTAEPQPAPSNSLALVMAAYADYFTWESYTLYQQTSLNQAMTLLGTGISRWATQNTNQQTIADIDRTNDALRGSIQRQAGLLSSEEPSSLPQESALNFIVLEGDVFFQAEGEREFRAVSAEELRRYADLGLPALMAEPDEAELLRWLENALSIEDLGRRRTRAGERQQFLLTFDVADSLSIIGPTLDGFTQPYADLVDPRALANALLDEGTLLLLVELDPSGPELQQANLLLEASLTVQQGAVTGVAAGDGFFQVEYAWQQDSSYENRGESFDISAPPQD